MRITTALCAFALVVSGVTALEAAQCQLEVSTPQPVLQAGKKQTTCLKVGVKGFEMKSAKSRVPLNIALVIDRSGSMNGEKMEQAKDAAIQALSVLNARDIVSVVIFDQEVEVLVPATKMTDRESVVATIKTITARGSTALHAGTERGGQEVRKFFDKNFVNRVILLSDGMANVGPATPEEVGKLGQRLGKDGISVTTLGLGDGYNEDMLAKLAGSSDGNHTFIEKATELADIFRKEFDTALSVVAQEVACTVTLPEGMRPVRSLNMDATIKGQSVTFGWNQIYSGHERYMMLEVEVPAHEDGQIRELGQAEVTYANMETKTTDKLSSKLDIRFSASESQAKESIIKPVMEEYIELAANENNKKAMQLRDEGKIEAARSAFSGNAAFLRNNAAALGGSSRLEGGAVLNTTQAEAVDSPQWERTRKGAVKIQYSISNQMKY